MKNSQIWKVKPKDGFEFIYRYYDQKGKSYIGHTKQSLCLRAGGSKGVNYTKYPSKFQKAIVEYGFDSFEFEILEEVSSKNVEEREKHYISKYDSKHNGYNSTYGGRAYYAKMNQLSEVIDLRKFDKEEICNLIHNISLFLKEYLHFNNNNIDEIFISLKQNDIISRYSYYAMEGNYLEIITHPALIVLNFLSVMISKKYANTESINEAMISAENLGGDILTGRYDYVKVLLISGDTLSFAFADY